MNNKEIIYFRLINTKKGKEIEEIVINATETQKTYRLATHRRVFRSVVSKVSLNAIQDSYGYEMFSDLPIEKARLMYRTVLLDVLNTKEEHLVAQLNNIQSIRGIVDEKYKD